MKKLGLIIVIVAITILLMESYLRKFYYEQLKTRTTSTNRLPDSLKVFNRVPKIKEMYVTPGVNNRFRSNNMGYVGNDFKAKKTSGVYRIIVVGNSNTVGKQINGSNNYCVVLQKTFEANNMKVEVINCGREGGEKDIQNLNIIKYEIVKYQPDLVLLESPNRLQYRRYVYEGYRNYTLEYDPLKPETRAECVRIVDNLYGHRYLTCLYDMSFIIRAICKRYIDKHSNWDTQKLYIRNNKFEIYLYSYIRKDAKVYVPVNYVTRSYALTSQKGVTSSLDSIGGKLILFTYGRYSNELKSIFREEKLNFIELKMDEYNYLPLSSKLEGHTNEIGHALIAERLFSQMILNNWIPKNIHCNDKDNL